MFCIICGKEITSQNRRKYCSDACARKAERQKSNAVTSQRERLKPFRTIICPDCGRSVTVHIKSVRCASCQAEQNKRNNAAYRARKKIGITRRIGNEYLCEACGKPFILSGSLQRWCPDCKAEQTRLSTNAHTSQWNRIYYSDIKNEQRRNASRRVSVPHDAVCPICGKAFVAPNDVVKVCSPDCRAKLSKLRNHNYHIVHKALISLRKKKHS